MIKIFIALFVFLFSITSIAYSSLVNSTIKNMKLEHYNIHFIEDRFKVDL